MNMAQSYISPPLQSVLKVQVHPPRLSNVAVSLCSRSAHQPSVSYLPRGDDPDRHLSHRWHEQHCQRAEDPHFFRCRAAPQRGENHQTFLFHPLRGKIPLMSDYQHPPNAFWTKVNWQRKFCIGGPDDYKFENKSNLEVLPPPHLCWGGLLLRYTSVYLQNNSNLFAIVGQWISIHSTL